MLIDKRNNTASYLPWDADTKVVKRKGLRGIFFYTLKYYPQMNTDKDNYQENEVEKAIDKQVIEAIKENEIEDFIAEVPLNWKKRMLIKRYYLQNLTDGQIAYKLRCSAGSIKAIRFRLGLTNPKN